MNYRAPVPSAERSPWQNGIAERLIATLRREYLNQIIVFGETQEDPFGLRGMLHALETFSADLFKSLQHNRPVADTHCPEPSHEDVA